MTKPYDKTEIEGVHWRRNSKNYLVLELHHTADPAKRDPAWLEAVRRTMPDENTFRREFLHDWTSGSGQAYYPEFRTVQDRVVRAAPGLAPGQPIYRGWDFGIRRSACVWAQYSPQTKTMFFLREVMPEMMGTYAFRDLVLYLSGEFDYNDLHVRAKAWVDRLTRDSRYPDPPWFRPSGSRPLPFIDISGKEANRMSAEVHDDTFERTSAQILAASEIYLRIWSGRVKKRTDVLRHLMTVRPDGLCGLVIDPACPILIEGLAGGVSFKKGSKLDPQPDEPAKNGVHEHIHDAAGYLAASVVDISDAPRPDPDSIVCYVDRDPYYMRDYVEGEQNTLGFKEVRSPVWDYRKGR